MQKNHSVQGEGPHSKRAGHFTVHHHTVRTIVLSSVRGRNVKYYTTCKLLCINNIKSNESIKVNWACNRFFKHPILNI